LEILVNGLQIFGTVLRISSVVLDNGSQIFGEIFQTSSKVLVSGSLIFGNQLLGSLQIFGINM
jgi:hypothetical protein